MNHPIGFTLVNSQAVDVNPWKALFANTFFWHELVHMYLAGYIVVGFLMAGAYAVARLRGRWGRYERVAFAISLTIAALAAPAQVLVGDWAARVVASEQPTKLAAIEGLQQTTKGASEHIFGWYHSDTGQVTGGIAIPKLLSLLADHNPNGTVQGLDAVPADDRPAAINVERYAFQLMVGIGTLLGLLGVVLLIVRWRRGRLPDGRWWMRCVVAAGPLSLVALLAGWTTTEVGRQPWIVYRVMRTSEAVTGAKGIPVGYAILGAAYVGVAVAVWWILRRLARAPLERDGTAPSASPAAPAGGGTP
jgi:cytochrome bd ubiquinol oxidase subunit I